MVRTEISLFLKNAPGELGRLAALLGEAGINIDALTIQDASNYVRELFLARGKSLKRIASAASYNSMRKDSAPSTRPSTCCPRPITFSTSCR